MTNYFLYTYNYIILLVNLFVKICFTWIQDVMNIPLEVTPAHWHTIFEHM